MFKVRDDEPAYAFIPDPDAPEVNRYGKAIELIDEASELANSSLNINGESGIGTNPNRYKQHGFYFNADNCIACHACEAACSEKNDLPPHIAFRSVGYVEGGSYPAFRRLNISMACNHCDDPVCLKGCPTRAYTKFAEYGAVLQDPDICFGCGYCTWVCPYNAPQLDTQAGYVTKCNMCVDRLEVGLKPACVSACLAGALDFGVIETTPANREQLEVAIPGFPTPEITHPNIRFQQTASLPREMQRTDSVPLRYERDEQGGGPYRPQVDKRSVTDHWKVDKLRSREDPLVMFTLISQAVIGAFLVLFLGPLAGVPTLTMAANPIALPVVFFGLLGLQTLALVLSTLHLGRPHRFYRAFNNLRYSPVSREVAGIAVFYNFFGAYALLRSFPGLFAWVPATFTELAGWGAAVSGPAALYFMHSIYRIPARPFWNHWQVLSSFFGSGLTLGALVVAVTMVSVNPEFAPGMQASRALAALVCTGLLVEAVGLWFHARDLRAGGGEGAAAFHQQTTLYRNFYWLRNAGLALAVLVSAGMAWLAPQGVSGLVSWWLLALVIVVVAVLGRAMFYVLVMPTTMPGGFFWHNPGFQHHARESGLADMPQVAVPVGDH